MRGLNDEIIVVISFSLFDNITLVLISMLYKTDVSET